MVVKQSDIDPELRTAATLSRLLMRPALWYFRFIYWLGRRYKSATPDGVSLKELWIDRSDGAGKIRLCIYRPADAADDEALPPVLYLHGGGYAVGNPEIAGKIIAGMIETKACTVVAPDYRKSLEAPYPAAIDDCYQTLLWLDENRRQAYANDDDIALIGHSAGGGLAIAVSLRARDRKSAKIAFQMPIYPMIDDRMNTPSSINNNAPVWNTKSNKLAWSLYLGDLVANPDTIPSDAAPARAENVADLPPTATHIGEHDPFLDETITFAQRLSDAAVPVKLMYAPGTFHSSESLAPGAAISQKANAFFFDTFSQGMERNFDTWVMQGSDYSEAKINA
ncbi:MAG: alpha/beta hydrolase [Pseudomonadota bacterium]